MRRRQILHCVGSMGALWLSGSAMPAFPAAAWDARVTSRPTASNHYASVGAAIDAAPLRPRRPYRIAVESGRWHEKLVISKPNIHLIGMDRRESILSFDAAAGMKGPYGMPWGTSGCASLTVCAEDFCARNLTIENAFDYLGHLYDPNFQPIGSNGLQAVALMLDRGADRCLLSDVDLIGHQDTVFVDQGRTVFSNCRISGSVDFVFGAGRAVFSRCTLTSRFRPGKPRLGYIAAPSTPRNEVGGLLFGRCRLEREAEVPDDSVLLGRAWRPTRAFADGSYGDPDAVGSALFSRCWMDAHIAGEGWDAMAYSARDGSRPLLDPADARLYEYRNHGPGALDAPQRRQLKRSDAAFHDTATLLGDWQPAS